MGSVGFTEIMVVLVVALIVLGPTRLPEAARSMGKALRELRNLTSGFEREVRAAFDGTDASRPGSDDGRHGIDPGALAPGMSYGQPVDPEPRPHPVSGPTTADDAPPQPPDATDR